MYINSYLPWSDIQIEIQWLSNSPEKNLNYYKYLVETLK